MEQDLEWIYNDFWVSSFFGMFFFCFFVEAFFYFLSLDDYLKVLSIVDDYSMFVYYFEWLFNVLILEFWNFEILIFWGGPRIFWKLAKKYKKWTKIDVGSKFGHFWSILIIFLRIRVRGFFESWRKSTKND